MHPETKQSALKEMATASPTASHDLHSTTEKENYLRIAQLVIVIGTKLMRELFNCFFPPSSLPNKLTDPATKNQLWKTLIKPQRDVLYPSQGVCGETKDFDISLLSKLIKTICPLPPPLDGWDDLPNAADHSLSADIVRIKVYRNAISHQYPNMEISDDEFCTLWNEIKKALLRIAGFLSTRRKWNKEINHLRNAPLTPDAEKNARELYEWYLKDMNMKEFTDQGLKNVQAEPQESSQRSEEGIARVERQLQGVQVSFEGESQRVNERVHQLEREIQDVKEETAQRIDEGVDHLDREIRGVHEGTERIEARVGRLERNVSQALQGVENEVEQLRQLVTMQAASSLGVPGG